MKMVKSLFILTTFLVSTTTVNAEVLKGCAAKKQAIEAQLQHAHSRGSIHEINGLQKALDENIRKCNDSVLRQQREEKVLEKQRKLKKIEFELQQAQKDQNLIKTRKKQAKLIEAQLELDKAKRQLDM